MAVDLNKSEHARSGQGTETAAGESRNVEGRGPEPIVGLHEGMAVIADALRLTPCKCRELLIMHRFDNLSYAEIARSLDLSESVVRKHISKALADCQKALAGTNQSV